MTSLKNCICRQVPWGKDGDGTSGECVFGCPLEDDSGEGGKGKRNTCAEGSSRILPYAAFAEKHKTACKICTDATVDICSKDCSIAPNGLSDKEFSDIIIKQHNIINNVACNLFNASAELVIAKQQVTKGIENINWAKKTTTTAKNMKNIQLLDKQNTLFTKKRLLLYDEKNDRIYRVVILILKTFLLILSLIVIKFLLND